MKRYKKIFLITSNRSEYGILRNLIYDLKKSKKLKLHLIVTGSHLNKLFGYTKNEIIKDKNKIFKTVKVNKSNGKFEKTYLQSSKIISSFSKLFATHKPDAILILGDRYEIFSVAIAAVFNNVPIAHLHGGEVTEGSMDEIFRHSITKMSNFHFVSTQKSKKRVLQLGENPKNIFHVGSLGVENIRRIKLLSRCELKKDLKINFNKKNILFSYHPDRKIQKIKKNMNNIFSALKLMKNTNIFMSMPNPDEGNFIVYKKIESVKKLDNFFFIKSMGSKNYLSMIPQMDLIIGNSSSGIIEAPSLKTPSIDIGDRQTGRERAKSVFHCEPQKDKITNLIKKVIKMKKKSLNFLNPYERINVSKNIIKVLENINYKSNLNKKFFNI
tara:strand:- start:240 stop:1388 length:1149 start_codon:yes stop_codon:yes gene_type:complete